ncbi:MAG TPA: metallophosphoesterase family protein [Burkholderiaceae bacterium]|nr:metallophosphoesterase family protein [Burkholderiaceae bacterium]
MRLGIITDLHANREASEAVFAHAETQGVERIAFLGDFVGYGADPGWVVDEVRKRVADNNAFALRGNHDAAVVDGPAPTMRPEPRQAVAWSREHLNTEQLAFLAGLPLRIVDGDRLYVHANAFAPAEWGYIVSRIDAARSMQATPCRMTFCGHVHEPMLYHHSGTGKTGDFAPTPGVPIPLSSHRQWLAIPGSVGQPRDGNPAACYAMFDTVEKALTFHRVPYDVETAAAKIRRAGLPPFFADRLRDGK